MLGVSEGGRGFDTRGRRNGENKDHNNLSGALPSEVFNCTSISHTVVDMQPSPALAARTSLHRSTTARRRRIDDFFAHRPLLCSQRLEFPPYFTLLQQASPLFWQHLKVFPKH